MASKRFAQKLLERIGVSLNYWGCETLLHPSFAEQGYNIIFRPCFP